MEHNRPLHLWLLSSISAILLSLPYLVPHTGLLMLIAFIPLLQLEKIIADLNIKNGWRYYYSSFLLWNILTTFWIYNATLAGAIAACILNALQMAVIFAIFRWFKRKTTPSLGYIFLILAWLAWEHFYFNAEISWPWLVLGNGFATTIKNIQWYEFTGTLGGSLWILLANIVIFDLLNDKNRRCKSFYIKLSLLFILIVLPLCISRIIFNSYKEKQNPREFVILQPNIDPYNEKFGALSQMQQNEILMNIANKAVTENTDFVIAPETFTSGVVENNLGDNRTFIMFKEMLGEKGAGNAIFGATTFYIYPGGPDRFPPTYTARRSERGWYDSFNSAIYLDTLGRTMIYHKSKLVVLVEYFPYPQYLKFLGSFAIDLGGTAGGFGTQKEREVFTTLDDSIKIGTAICYESIYGDFYREYIINGANVMSIITNDGWWGNTPGYKQHLRYSSLRAIETRRSIARCANTGISAFIDQRGIVTDSLGWWQRGYLKGNLNLNDRITVFVKYGDYIGRGAYASMLLFVGLFILIVLKIYGKERG
ncbi:MAG TPA: apolipoprotein N-acyltransferase [Bacteroidales bacterium]|nr:apolipoprotein N-acyltransferase [Bacteroidales bacterium]HRR49389.1 apolipoprotein N-acyltransferase [Bacteroidales bacterium]HRT84223.1 apolipoprotein N-acyltransferase [Bacteroidales bacterium]